MLNLAIVLSENARRFPDRTAVICDDQQLTYGQLEEQTNRLASSLVKLGLHPGQKMLIMLPNIPEFVVAYFGILKPGGVVVPINVLQGSRDRIPARRQRSDRHHRLHRVSDRSA
jgi:long-chain acyl-CoA synthetase